jgi:hypothetical protein
MVAETRERNDRIMRKVEVFSELVFILNSAKLIR